MDIDRVVTTKFPGPLVSRLEHLAIQIDRSKSWIVREAVTEWLAEHELRHQLTLEALQDVHEGRTIPHKDILAHLAGRILERRGAADGLK